MKFIWVSSSIFVLTTLSVINSTHSQIIDQRQGLFNNDYKYGSTVTINPPQERNIRTQEAITPIDKEELFGHLSEEKTKKQSSIVIPPHSFQSTTASNGHAIGQQYRGEIKNKIEETYQYGSGGGQSLSANEQMYCSSPRIWNGYQCVCKNNGRYISGNCHNGLPSDSNDRIVDLKYIKRTFDGSENNQLNTQWGSKEEDLLRLCPADYKDSISEIWDHKPNPREISNLVGDDGGDDNNDNNGNNNNNNNHITEDTNINMLFPIWGQFVAHDISHTTENKNESIPIKVPMCDKQMDSKCLGNEELPLMRSVYNPSKRVRTQINKVTGWLDGSVLYGSDKETSDSLREFRDGKLKTSKDKMLPKDKKGFYESGDQRTNAQIALTSFHTVFMREHNRACEQALMKNPTLTDEETFQIARNFVIGLIQHITYDEFLPILLGKPAYQQLIGEYVRYDSSINPGIFTEFSTAAFRVGHSLINSPFKMTDNSGKLLRYCKLGEMFFNPSLLSEENMNEMLNGLKRTSMKKRSLEFVNEMRNFLFVTPKREVKIDLFSFNIQRGRDHGIGSTKCVMDAMGMGTQNDLGLGSASPFNNLFENQEKSKILEKLYQNLSNLDLWLAIIGEKAEYGAVLGNLGIRLNALQFKNIRDADRYWYENIYPKEIIQEIKETSLADVISRNSDIEFISDNAFQTIF